MHLKDDVTMTPMPALPPLVDTMIHRGTLLSLDEGERARVLLEEGPADPIECDVLHAADAPPSLAPGDLLLVWQPAPGERGVVLGRVGPTNGPTSADPAGPPTELVLEATHSLTLRVGDGSITIREDGKVLIKGKDLVSHATRTNRIKGGAVQIN